ncbi:hypothetical protein IEO21_05620 [Rhodonia placenta]|uniref:Uncharacterized protein n=1 Tax=Rhodonia placenta TaxID=104341 RepID=A0A8H7P1M3_9APHY|nr:hypothetical protein IEO21_05620 [Postia placenta]
MNPSYLLKQDIVARLYEGSESDNRSVCNLESIWDTDKITPVAVVHLVCSESTQASGAWSYHWWFVCSIWCRESEIILKHVYAACSLSSRMRMRSVTWSSTDRSDQWSPTLRSFARRMVRDNKGRTGTQGPWGP